METDRLEDMRDSPRRKRAASPDSASKRRTQTPASSSSRDVSPPSPSPAQEYPDASPSSSRSTETMEYELPPRSYVPYAQGRNPYSVNGGRYESNSEVHDRLAGWSMNELGSMDHRPPPNWAPNNALRRESMYAASSPQAVRDALLAARAERAERLERLERLERAVDRPYLSRYEPLRDPLRRRNPEAQAAQAAQAALDPASLFTEAGPSGTQGSLGAASSGSESGSSGLASSSSFEPNWDMTGMYTRRTPASTYASQMRVRERERIAAFERRIYGMNGPTYGQHGHPGHPSQLGQGQAGHAGGYAQVPGPLGTSPASAAAGSSHAGHAVAGSSHAAAATTPFGSALERGYYAYARGDPYTLIAVPPEFARYAFGRRRLPASLEGMDEDQRRQAARDALDTVSRLGPEERRRLAEKVLQKVAYSDLCSHASAASASSSHSAASAPETSAVMGGMMDNVELPAEKSKITWDAEVESACAICQDDYSPQDESVLTPCGHMYHSSCLGTWLARHNPAASTCPMCRRDLACLAVLRKMSDEGEAKRLWVSVGDEGERGGWI